MSEDMNDDNDLEPARTVQLVDEKSGETLTMEVFIEVDHEGKNYGLLTPTEPLVNILRVTGEGDDESLEEIEPADFKSIEGAINEALKRFQAQIIVRADEFVLRGDIDHEDFGKLFDDPDFFEGEDEDGEDEEFLILDEVDTGSARYVVAMPATPAMFPVELVGDDLARSLSDAELERLEPLFQELLAQIEDDDEDEE